MKEEQESDVGVSGTERRGRKNEKRTTNNVTKKITPGKKGKRISKKVAKGKTQKDLVTLRW